jgi:hypothetical protein
VGENVASSSRVQAWVLPAARKAASTKSIAASTVRRGASPRSRRPLPFVAALSAWPFVASAGPARSSGAPLRVTSVSGAAEPTRDVLDQRRIDVLLGGRRRDEFARERFGEKLVGGARFAVLEDRDHRGDDVAARR